jgi:hypothetical protein
VFILTLDNDLTACGDPIWIINYTDKYMQNAVNLKITALDRERYFLIWECMGRDGYQSAFMTIILTYLYFSFIFRGNIAKTSLYTRYYRDGNWGFGVQLGWAWQALDRSRQTVENSFS